MICLGVSVGPDGNIYSVGAEGPGVFSSRRRALCAGNNPKFQIGRLLITAKSFSAERRRPAALLSTRTTTFGPYGSTAPRSLHLPSWADPRLPRRQRALPHSGPTRPNGSLLWTFQSPYPYNVLTTPDVGSDGTHYFGQNLSQLFALNTNGTQRWHATLNSYVGGPIVDSLNTQLVMGSQETGDHAGFILSASAQDAHETVARYPANRRPNRLEPRGWDIRLQRIRQYARAIRRQRPDCLHDHRDGDRRQQHEPFLRLLP